MASVIRYVQAARGAGDTYFIFTAPAVQAAAGNYLLVLVDTRKTGGDIAALPPVWNGETLTEVFSPEIAFTAAESGNEDPMKRVQFFGKHLTSSATADVTCAVDGFKAGNILALVCDSVNTGTALSALFKQQVWDTYSNPSLNVTGVASGDLVVSFLASTSYGGGYSDVSATVWSPNGGQTAISSMTSDEPRTGKFLSSSKTGTGTVTVGYTPDVNEPRYAHYAFILKNASSNFIDTITTDGSAGLVVGEDFAITTTGLGSFTFLYVDTIATPAASVSATTTAPSGDGTGTMPYWVDGGYYPFIGSVRTTATDGLGNSASATFALSLPDDQLDVVFSAVETTDDTYIGTKLDDIGHPLADGDVGYYPVGNGLAIAENGHISCLGAMVFVLWIHKLSGIMEMYTVTINDAGEITDVRGISSRGISSRGISSRHISSRGIA